MTFFQDLYKKLFSNSSPIAIHEVLTRSATFLAEYGDWKKTESSQEILNELSRSWHFKKNNIKSSIEIELYISPYSNGLTIFSGSGMERISLAFLMEYIKETLLENKYRIVHNDRKIQETENFVLMLERYFLKPNPIQEAQINQLYGNILIEVKYQDNEEVWLKIMANVHSGRKYKDPRDFNELITLLFDN